MRKSTLRLLVLLVAGLATLWLLRAKETIQGGPALGEYALCPDFSADRVRLIRIEHLERSFQMAVERDAAGRWFLTDPLAYPAQGALLRTLLDALGNARGEPASEVARAAVGLDPPKVVVECVQVGESGERTLRFEFGALDLDSSRVYARIPGHPNAAAGGTDVFRTTRMLVNTLERNPDDYRERRATSLSPQDVVSLRRRGQLYRPEEGTEVDLFFDSLTGPDGWKRVGQATVTLDPNAMGLLVRGATDLEIERFADDSPRDFDRYGLAPPRFTVELGPTSGAPVVLAFGFPPTEKPGAIGEHLWFCQRLGYAHVWEVAARSVELLAQPAGMFFDQAVLRVLRTDVARLELEGGGARRTLAREKKGWSVWEGEEGGVHHPGNTAAIEEALAVLERAQLAEHFESEAFEALAPPVAFHVVLQNGAELGGRLGRPTKDPQSGAQGPQFLRDGDEIVALVDPSVLELCRRPLEDFRSRKVVQFQESLVRAVTLENLAARRAYTFINSGDNLWSPEGEAIRAPDDFVQSLDALLNLAAKRWLSSIEGAQERLNVTLQPTEGEHFEFSFLTDAQGTTYCRTESGLLAETDGELLRRLLSLF